MHERKPRVLVTGGAGYLGSTLVPQLLADGFSVRVLDTLRYGGRSLLGVWSHPGFQFLRGDIRDRAMVRASLEDIDAVVHLAAIVGDPACAREPAEARAVNLDASVQLLELCRERRHVTRFVFASTCSNYGRMDDPDMLVDESSALRPLSLYAETKVAFEQMLIERRETAPNIARANGAEQVHAAAVQPGAVPPRMRTAIGCARHRCASRPSSAYRRACDSTSRSTSSRVS